MESQKSPHPNLERFLFIFLVIFIEDVYFFDVDTRRKRKLLGWITRSSERTIVLLSPFPIRIPFGWYIVRNRRWIKPIKDSLSSVVTRNNRSFEVEAQLLIRFGACLSTFPKKKCDADVETEWGRALQLSFSLPSLVWWVLTQLVEERKTQRRGKK